MKINYGAEMKYNEKSQLMRQYELGPLIKEAWKN